MTEESILLKMMDEREAAYAQLTSDILDQLQNLLEGVEEVLDPEIVEWLEWKDVVLAGDVLTLAGIVHSENEDELESEEDFINHIVRVGIPLSLAETGTVEEIVNYLNEQSPGSIHEPRSSLQPPEVENEISVAGLTENQVDELIFHELNTSRGKVH